MASAYVRSFSGASRISLSTNTAGLGSYVPVLGLTNIVHTRESSSSQSASPRCALTAWSYRVNGVKVGRGVP